MTTLTHLRTATANLRRAHTDYVANYPLHGGLPNSPYTAELARAEAEVNAALDALEGAQGVPVLWQWRWADKDDWREFGRKSSQAARADFIRDQERIAPIVTRPLYALSPAHVPEGMVMVPREPTDAMLSAFYRDSGEPALKPRWFAAAYRAMIAAAQPKEPPHD